MSTDTCACRFFPRFLIETASSRARRMRSKAPAVPCAWKAAQLQVRAFLAAWFLSKASRRDKDEKGFETATWVMSGLLKSASKGLKYDPAPLKRRGETRLSPKTKRAYFTSGISDT